MLYTLENEWLCVTVADHGAELKSMKEKADGTEYLWNGDPSWWKYSSPVLFPIVGKLANGKYRIGEHQYELPGHGLGRISDFVLVRKEKDAICLALDWSEDSLEKYPYKFRLEISYKLAGHTVQVGWQVKSQEEMRDMYFSIGAHPALCCPIEEEEEFTDCYLEFERAENSSRILTLPNGLISHERTPSLKGMVQPLSYDIFRDGALVYDDLRSSRITIKSRQGRKSIAVEAKGFPYWGIWSPEKGGAPFVCLEPWFGHGDFEDFAGDFREKAGIQKLEPGQTFTAGYRFIINEKTE